MKLRTGKDNHLKTVSVGDNYIKPAIGHRKISALTEQMLQDIIDGAASKGVNGKPLSKKSLMNLKAEIMAFLKYCRKSNATALYPESLTIPVGAKKVGKTILQPEQLKILFTSDLTTYRRKLQRDPNIHAYRFSALTGLRPGEIIGLRWEDVGNGFVDVKRSINRFGEETDGKNENAIRRVYFGIHAQSVIDEQPNTSEWVFPIGTLKRYETALKRYCECNGVIPAVTPYELRHTFVSVAKQLPDGQVKSIVGHSQSMDTFGIYGHEVQGEGLQTAAALDELFNALFKAQN